MTVYVSAPELPLVLAFTDADVDAVVAEIGHWASAGLTNVFRSDGEPSFVVNFGRVTAFTIGAQPDEDAGKAVFPIEIGHRAETGRVQQATADHGHDHGPDHDH